MNDRTRLILTFIISLVCGILLIPIVFLLTWGIIESIIQAVSGVDNGRGLIFEIFWTLNYLVFYLMIGIWAKKYIEKKNLSKCYIFSIAMVLLPITFWLWLFSAIADSPHKEYIPRIIWVISPLIGYFLGILISSDKKLKA